MLVENGRVDSIQLGTPENCGKANNVRHTASSGHSAHTNVESLVGSNAIHANDVMAEWGFRSIDTFTNDDELYSIFWKASTHECVQLNSKDNHVFSVNRLTDEPRCR